MWRLPFSARLGAFICLIGSVMTWVSLFLPFIHVTGASNIDYDTAAWISSLFLGQAQTPLLITVAVLCVASLLVPPLVSLGILWSKRSLLLAVVSFALIVVALCVSIFIDLTSISLWAALTQGSPSKSPGPGLALLTGGYIICLLGSAMQLKRGQRVIVERPAAPAKPATPQYSYFQEKAMNLHREKGHLRD